MSWSVGPTCPWRHFTAHTDVKGGTGLAGLLRGCRRAQCGLVDTWCRRPIGRLSPTVTTTSPPPFPRSPPTPTTRKKFEPCSPEMREKKKKKGIRKAFSPLGSRAIRDAGLQTWDERNSQAASWCRYSSRAYTAPPSVLHSRAACEYGSAGPRPHVSSRSARVCEERLFVGAHRREDSCRKRCFFFFLEYER